MKKSTRILSIITLSVLFLTVCSEQASNRSVQISKEPTLGNEQLDEAVRNYLLSEKHFSWQTAGKGQNFCVFENLDPKNELFPFYLWVRCSEFVMENNQLKEKSGMSGPTKIDYPNELSFYDTEKMSHTAPRDGGAHSHDIKSIFPSYLQKKVFNYDATILKKRISEVAYENLSL